MSEIYRRAGVDVEAGAEAVSLISGLAAMAQRPEVRESIGGFAGLFDIGGGRLLAAGTDGVGTKIEIARMLGKLDTIGIDLVAMCADDVVCTGAEPLFFLDYLAVGKVQPEEVASIVKGIAEGCRMAGCALLGGETAEHPVVMAPTQFDLAGFCVGIVEERKVLNPKNVRFGDVLIGLESSGLHSNGYSLVRQTLTDRHEIPLDSTPFGFLRPLGEDLLEPTRIYAPLIVDLARRDLLTAVAHITGGGIHENLPRALPSGMGATLEAGSWHIAPLFDLVQQVSGATKDEMYGTFNMGLGMVLVVPETNVDEVLAASQAFCPATVIGQVTATPGIAIS